MLTAQSPHITSQAMASSTLDGRPDGRSAGRADGRTDGRTDGRMDGQNLKKVLFWKKSTFLPDGSGTDGFFRTLDAFSRTFGRVGRVPQGKKVLFEKKILIPVPYHDLDKVSAVQCLHGCLWAHAPGKTCCHSGGILTKRQESK